MQHPHFASFASFAEFRDAACPFFIRCEAFLRECAVRVELTIDHICYKCSSSTEYNALRALLEDSPPSTYFYQVVLAGRRVGYAGLLDGICYDPDRPTVRCIELSDRKPTALEQPGFHHVELFAQSDTLDNVLSAFADAGVVPVLRERPHHTTHDIILDGGFIVRLTDRPLIKKIVAEQLSA